MSKIINFHDVKVDEQFTLNGMQYIKIPEERISCCRSFNAAEATNRNAKIQVVPITQVEVND